jgi:hypothetical protein
MYRSKDESFMTALRHKLMTNSGTEWLSDRRWAYDYLGKYIKLEDLHLWASQKSPGEDVPMGTGPLDAPVLIITERAATVDERKFIQTILTPALAQSAQYHTARFRAPSEALYESDLLSGEVSVIRPRIIVSFGVKDLRGLDPAQAVVPPCVIEYSGSQLILLHSLEFLRLCDQVFLHNVQDVIKRTEPFLS